MYCTTLQTRESQMTPLRCREASDKIPRSLLTKRSATSWQEKATPSNFTLHGEGLRLPWTRGGTGVRSHRGPRPEGQGEAREAEAADGNTEAKFPS